MIDSFFAGWQRAGSTADVSSYERHARGGGQPLAVLQETDIIVLVLNQLPARMGPA